MSVTDIGQGAVLIEANGTFLPGTTVRIRNTYLPPDKITATHDSLRFTTLASAIVAGDMHIVGRDSREIKAIHPLAEEENKNKGVLKVGPFGQTDFIAWE